MKLRDHLPPGYVTYTGRVMRAWEVERYNRIQDDINAWIRDNRSVPEHLLNESFDTLQAAALEN
jgi:hypothetical protein